MVSRGGESAANPHETWLPGGGAAVKGQIDAWDSGVSTSVHQSVHPPLAQDRIDTGPSERHQSVTLIVRHNDVPFAIIEMDGRPPWAIRLNRLLDVPVACTV